MQFIVAALYHFFDFSQFEAVRMPLLEELKRLNITGSILLAPEGINGTVAGTRADIDQLLAHLETQIVKSPFEVKESTCKKQPFRRAKVRLKRETISIGEPVSLGYVGQYVTAQDWNALIEDPETIIIDARNAYEVRLGTFENARDPNTRTFKQLPGYMREQLAQAKQKKIATFCTGGIRCEKFTAWLSQEGYENVYHLKGGILKYLEEIPQGESKWQGECFVFDKRVAVGHGLAPSTINTMCFSCGNPLTPEDRAQSAAHNIECVHCEA